MTEKPFWGIAILSKRQKKIIKTINNRPVCVGAYYIGPIGHNYFICLYTIIYLDLLWV